MSEKHTPAADPASAEAHSAAQQGNFSQPIIIERKHSTGKGIATGALALSVLALGASGLLFVQGKNTFQIQEERVRQELEKAALGESENARRLTTSLSEQQAINGKVGELDVRQQKNIQHIADLQNAYRELLQGRVNWLVDEVEVTLNLAAQQLTLSGNVPVAITALESIEQRLSRFEQAELQPIKKAVSQDLNTLKQNAASYLDVSGTALKLDSLEKAVPGLPLIVDSTLQAKPLQAAEIPESADFWTRTWDKTVHLLQSMMEIRKLDSTDAMLLTPEQIYFVRANLRLRLLDARLALLQHNSEVYKNNLAEVESTVRQYFDVKSPTTQKWLEALAQLNQQNLSIVSDDALKDSLAAVRAYQTQVRTTVPVNITPVENLPAVTLPAPVQAAAPQQSAEENKAEDKAPAASVPAAPAKTPEAASQPAQTEAASGKSDTGKSGAALTGLAAPIAAALLTAKTESAAAEPVKSAPAPAVQAAAPERKAEEKAKPAERKPKRAEAKKEAAKHKRSDNAERQRQNRSKQRREAERAKPRKAKARSESGGGESAAEATP